jgi:hypothetical protein
MQRWEYKTILRSRGWDEDKDSPRAKWLVGTDWNVDIVKELEKLGNEGWELVAVSSRSSYLGGHKSGSMWGYSDDYAGFTNQELWVFKRPKT